MVRCAVALLVALCVVVAAQDAAAQRRLQFDPGKTGTYVKDRTTGGPDAVPGRQPVSYVLRARAEQRMLVAVRSPKDNARFQIYAPGRQLMEDAVKRREYVGTLPASGDYEILIYPRDGVDTDFTLEVSVMPPQKQSRDAELLEQLKRDGANLEKPHAIDFELSFESEANAKRAAAKLKAEGFATRAQQIDRSITWWVVARRTLVPREADLAKLRHRLRVIAAQEEGEYDTWSAQPVK